ncbi:MAG TPA: phage tail protein [Pyrinomonadaceae bacterium]
MANPANEQVNYPFTAFNFAVEIKVDGVAMQVVDAAFSECDGLDMSMEVKTIREGGNNGKQIRLTGPLTYGQVTMKRGMTANLELWDWFNLMLTDQSLRADAEVVIFASDGQTERARFQLSRCVPVKLKSPALNAKDGAVAIEELQLAYEKLTLKKPQR